jgi:hypothetical protein
MNQPWVGAGAIGGFFGTSIFMTEALEDGTVAKGPAGIHIGTGPRSFQAQARIDAHRIVRTGLAEVLEWLGEKPWSEPSTGAELLSRLKEG